MIIQTLEKKYTVIKYIFSDRDAERYICKEESGKEKYTVVCVKNRMWIRKAMKFLVQQMESRYFTDFVSCFFSEECLYVVMKYAEGISLKAKLERESCSLRERMAVGKNILERLMILNMPDYFLQDCLKPETVILSSALEVNFQYELSKIGDYDKAGFSQVQNCLGKLFAGIFVGELGKNMLPPIRGFCDLLGEGKYQDILEVYTEYGKVCKAVNELPPQELTLPKTWGFRVWERIRRCFVPLKKICAVILMLLAVAFLIYSVHTSMEEGSEKKVFDLIGTLEIK